MPHHEAVDSTILTCDKGIITLKRSPSKNVDGFLMVLICSYHVLSGLMSFHTMFQVNFLEMASSVIITVFHVIKFQLNELNAFDS